MSKLKTTTLIAALLLWAAAGALAEDEGGLFLDGEASVGLHYYGLDGELGRVGQYVSARDVDDTRPDLKANLFGGTSTTLYNVLLMYRDPATKAFGLDINTGSLVSGDYNYRSFDYNIGHDQMKNLQARQEVWKPPLDSYGPGGKMIFYTDNDENGRYSMNYERSDANLTVDLPVLSGGKVYGIYGDQRRHGWKQSMTIDHCAYCHVEGNRREIDNRVQTWKAGLEGAISRVVGIKYEYTQQDYFDYTKVPDHRWKDAMHPIYGATDPVTPANYEVEFGSRVIFDDVTLPYNRASNSKKQRHHAGLKVDVSPKQLVSGSYTNNTRRNYWTGVESNFDAWVANWTGRFGKKLRVNARFMAYENKVDDVFVDLPNFREGRPDGGQNFDWTRVSANNRQVAQGDLIAGYKLGKSGYLKGSWRHKTVDRDAMATSGTNYLYDASGNGTEVAATPYKNKSTYDVVRLMYIYRPSRKSKTRASYTFTNVDQAFMNPWAMCEESLVGTNPAGADGRIYYYQRQRTAMGTSLPSQSHRFTFNGSYQLSSRTSLSAYFNYAKEKNDQLNSYEFDRDIMAPGFSFWTAPGDRIAFTLGYAYNQVKSNAKLCPPLFDG